MAFLEERDKQLTDKETQMQEQKLQQLLQYVSQHSPFYKELFAKHQIDIGNIKTIADLTQIPPTHKEDVQQRNNDFLCVPTEQVVEYTSTSGTLGGPVTIALTENGLNLLSYNRSEEHTSELQ